MRLGPGTANDADAIAEPIAGFQRELTDSPDGAGADDDLVSVGPRAERAHLGSPRFVHMVAEREGAMLGFIARRHVRHVLHRLVARPHQRRGVARRLWHRARACAIGTAAPREFTVSSCRRGIPAYRAGRT
jgi:GNAT superfamily N-acetyltransferase